MRSSGDSSSSRTASRARRASPDRRISSRTGKIVRARSRYPRDRVASAKGLLADREGLEVVDRRPQIAPCPLDDHLEYVIGDLNALPGSDGPKYVFHRVLVNALKFNGPA